MAVRCLAYCSMGKLNTPRRLMPSVRVGAMRPISSGGTVVERCVLQLSISIILVRHFKNLCHNIRCALRLPSADCGGGQSTIDVGMSLASVPADWPAIRGRREPPGAIAQLGAVVMCHPTDGLMRPCGKPPRAREQPTAPHRVPWGGSPPRVLLPLWSGHADSCFTASCCRC
jgi:hypothetical protein